MKPARDRAFNRGFTLLEVILVVLIFGIMSTMAYGGLNSVLKTRTAVEASMKRTADLQKTYLRMRTDFQNLALRSARDNFGDSQPALIGGREQIVELTRGGWRNPLYLKRSSMERVVYRLTEKKLERAGYRVLDRAQDSEPVRVTLIDRVDELRWRYLDKDREWIDQWPPLQVDDASKGSAPPPLAIEVTLVTQDLGSLRFVFRPGGAAVPVELGQGVPVQPDRTPPANNNGGKIADDLVIDPQDSQ